MNGRVAAALERLRPRRNISCDVGENLFRPALRVPCGNHTTHPAHSVRLLKRRHVERRSECPRDLIGVVRIHDQGVSEFVRRAGKRAQYQHTLLIVSRRHELLAHQVHPVVQAADITEICGAQEPRHRCVIVMRRQQHNRRRAATEPFVDPFGHRHDAFSRLTIHQHRLAAWLRDLCKDKALSKIRPALQQAFHGEKLLFYPLGVIETIHADSKPDIGWQTKLASHVGAAFRHRRRRREIARPRNRGGIDADAHATSLPFDDVGVDVDVRESLDTAQEVVAIERRLKSEQRAAEQAFEQRLTPWAATEGLRRWPRDVPEGRDAAERQFPPNHRRCQCHVVVVRKDDGCRDARLFGHSLCVSPVDDLVMAEVVGVERGLHRGAVTQRPEGAVRKSFVMALMLVSVQPDATQPISRAPWRHIHAVGVVGFEPVDVTLPRCDPDAAILQQQRFDGVDDARRLTNRLDGSISGALMAIWFTVGQDDDLLF